ncbi:MAG: diheme cytochrome c-553, partial [bacterium]
PKVMTAEGPVPDAKRLLSGHPAGTVLPTFDPDSIKPGGWVLFTDDLTACVGPFGVICAANLTPDDATGTGLWKEENFVNAMRTGKHMGMGEPILPPMPWQNVRTLTDEDLKAVYAYLRSLPPIKNQVPGAMTLQDVKSE